MTAKAGRSALLPLATVPALPSAGCGLVDDVFKAVRGTTKAGDVAEAAAWSSAAAAEQKSARTAAEAETVFEAGEGRRDATERPKAPRRPVDVGRRREGI